jgi:hypothetical protein
MLTQTVHKRQNDMCAFAPNARGFNAKNSYYNVGFEHKIIRMRRPEGKAGNENAALNLAATVISDPTDCCDDGSLLLLMFCLASMQNAEMQPDADMTHSSSTHIWR